MNGWITTIKGEGVCFSNKGGRDCNSDEKRRVLYIANDDDDYEKREKDNDTHLSSLKK